MEIARLRRTASRLALAPFQSSSTPLPGANPSRLRGPGVSFLGYRDYQFGDDIRHVDWNVTARHARPMLKTFEQEQASAFMLVLDASASMRAPANDKWTQATELAAIIALIGARESELLGGLVVSAAVESQFAPGRGMRHAVAFARWLASHQPLHHTTALSVGVNRAMRTLQYPGVIIIFSDFIDPGWDAAVRQAVGRHTVVAVAMCSPHDERLPGPGLVRVRDAESGRIAWIDSSPASRRADFEARVGRARLARRHRLVAAGAIHLEAMTGTSHALQLRGLCRQRRG